jgi:hypothetical protein
MPVQEDEGSGADRQRDGVLRDLAGTRIEATESRVGSLLQQVDSGL